MTTGTWQRRKGIQLAYPFEEKRLSKWRPPYLVQPKYDGERCRAVPSPEGYLLFSSEENLITAVPHINRELGKLLLEDELELDGELYLHGMPFEMIHSIVSRKKNIHELSERMEYWVFDLVDERLMQGVRFKYLVELAQEVLKPLKRVKFGPYWICYSLEEVLQAYDECISREFEGIVVRDLAAPYVRKRSTQMMKFKPKKNDVYEIIGTIEEVSKDGVPKGSLGALRCKSHNDLDTFQVGTGFSAEQRRWLWEQKEELPGKYARVSYQHITSGKGVPRFPVFVEILDDWDELNIIGG